jgi:two-component sensor histidine kinase
MTTTERFGSSDESVGAARAFVAGTIPDVTTDIRDSVALMVSELATNALVHATGGFEVVVDRSDHEVFVSISDRGEGTPVLQAPPSSEPHGRGLRIVDTLSDGWGISPLSDGGRHGKTVWFRMSLTPSDGNGDRDGDGDAMAGGTGTRRPDRGERR